MRALLILLLSIGAVLLGGCDWTQYRYGESHDGANPTERTIGASNVGGLAQVWRANIGSPVESSPVVAGGVVYVGADDGKLYAFSTACGSHGSTSPSAAP